MSCSIFIRGRLKKSASMADVAEKCMEKCKQFGWDAQWMPKYPAVVITICPEEILTLHEQKRQIDSIIKISTENQDVPDKIFDILWEIKPLFYQFYVTDDFGLWDAYQLKRGKTKPVVLRELTPTEKQELQVDLTGDKNSENFFYATSSCAVLMDIMYKDLHLKTKEEILENLRGDIKAFWLDYYQSPAPNYAKNNAAFLCACRDYTMKMLLTKRACSDARKEVLANLFSSTMQELVCGRYSPGTGTKYLALVKFRNSLIGKGVDFENRETALRYIYSAMDYLGLVRPEVCKTPSVAMPTAE